MKKEIIKYFKSKLTLLGDIKFFKDNVDYLAGIAKFNDPKDPVNLCFSIPVKSKHFFFTITECESIEMVSELSSIQYYCENYEEICINHSVPTDNDFMVKHNYAGYVVISAHFFHKCLDDELVIGNEKYKGIGVVPINKKELQIKQNNGIKSLFDYWDSIEKDILGFNQ